MGSPIRMAKAYVLHRRPYRERSFFVDVLAFQTGWMSMIAHQVWSLKSPLSRVLEPLRAVELSYYERKGRFVLVNGDLCRMPPHDLPTLSLYGMLYAHELILYVVHRLGNAPELFGLYESLYNQVMSDPNKLALGLRAFEYELLSLTGYGLDCESDTTGTAISLDSIYQYVPHIGFRKLSINELNLSPELGIVDGLFIKRLAGDREANSMSAMKRFLRFVWSAYLGALPLSPRQYIRSVSRKVEVCRS